MKENELLKEIHEEMCKLTTHSKMFLSALDEHSKCLEEYNSIIMSLPNVRDLIPVIKRDGNNRELLGESITLIGDDIISIYNLEEKLYE